MTKNEVDIEEFRMMMRDFEAHCDVYETDKFVASTDVDGISVECIVQTGSCIILCDKDVVKLRDWLNEYLG